MLRQIFNLLFLWYAEKLRYAVFQRTLVCKFYINSVSSWWNAENGIQFNSLNVTHASILWNLQMVRSFATGNSDSQLIIQIENMNNFLIAMGKSCYTLHSFVVMHDSSSLCVHTMHWPGVHLFWQIKMKKRKALHWQLNDLSATLILCESPDRSTRFV